MANLNLTKMNQLIKQNLFQRKKLKDIKMMKNPYLIQKIRKKKKSLSRKDKRETTPRRALENLETTLAKLRLFKTIPSLRRF